MIMYCNQVSKFVERVEVGGSKMIGFLPACCHCYLNERNLRSEDAAQQKSMHSQEGKKDTTVDGQ